MSTCPICWQTDSSFFAQTSDVEYGTSDKCWEYRKCFCGVIFLQDPPINQLQAIYPPEYYSFDANDLSYFRKALSYTQARRIRKLIPASTITFRQMADVGGGVGSISSLVRESLGDTLKSIVIDLDESCRQTAVKNGHEFFCSTVENYPNQSEFQLILLLNVIEHVENPTEVLQKLWSCLEPGGFLILQTPNTNSLDCQLFRHRSWGGFHAPRHWVLFNEKNFSALAKSVGYDIKSMRWVQGSPFWAVSICSMVSNWLSCFGIKKSFPIHKRNYFLPILGISVIIETIRRIMGLRTSQMIFVLSRPLDVNH